jgi:hypothetical protein
MLSAQSHRTEDLFFYTALTLLMWFGWEAAVRLRDLSDTDLGRPIGVIESEHGVRRHASSLTWGEMGANSELYVHDVIYAPPGVSLKLVLKDHSRLTLEPESLIELEEPLSGGNSFHLLRGQAAPHGNFVAPRQVWSGEVDRIIEKKLKPPPPVIPPIEVDSLAALNPVDPLDEAFHVLLARTQLLVGTRPRLEAMRKMAAEIPSTELSDYRFQLIRPAEGQVFPEGWIEFAWAPVPLPGVQYEVEVSRDAHFSRSITYQTSQWRIRIGFTNTATFEATKTSSYFWRVRAILGNKYILTNSREVKFTHLDQGDWGEPAGW